MKAHVQNPWTRSPQLFVHLSVEEAQQIKAGMDEVFAQFGALIHEHMDANQQDALEQLQRVIGHALSTDRPHGIKGTMP